MAWPRSNVALRDVIRNIWRSTMQPTARQQPFTLVAPMLRAALLLGAAGGFALASALSVSLALRLPLGPWWAALAQAHGRLQVFGWAGVFVLGVAFHFLPRLRGAPLRWPQVVPWLLGAQVAGLLLRALSQPLLALAPAGPGALAWRIALVGSGALETLGLGLAVAALIGTAIQPDAPKLRARPALWSVWPLLICVVVSLGLAPLVNLVATIQAVGNGGIVPAVIDDASVTLGLFGFLTPMALAMSARALPLYAGLQAIPRRILWPIAFAYSAGLALALVGDLMGLARVHGLGLALLGLALMSFIVIITRMMMRRGHLPAQVRQLAPTPEQAARNYTRHISDERARFGPYVACIASAYAWALLAGLLLALDGAALALGDAPLVTLDAARHSIAVGFIALLLAGVSVRMIPGFSGGSITSPRLVTTLLWLGNGAALLRVGSLLAQPLLAALGSVGAALDSAFFGLSGPLGLTFAICLAITLWPALPLAPRAPAPQPHAERATADAV